MKLLLFLISLNLFSEIFYYLDNKNNKIYVDHIEKVPSAFKDSIYSLDKNISKSPPVSYELNKKEEPIILLVSQGCQYCTMAEDFLIKNNLKFNKLDVFDDGEKLYNQLGGSGVPILKYKNQIIRGFDIPILEMDGYEADDIIGTLSKKAVEKGGNAVRDIN